MVSNGAAAQQKPLGLAPSSRFNQASMRENIKTFLNLRWRDGWREREAGKL
jgi:hypothetical protein